MAFSPFLAASWLRAAPPSPTPLSREALTLLHQGRFRQAAARFGSVSDRYPADPEGPLFEALTTWYRLLDAPEDPELRRLLMESLDEATRRGEALVATRDSQRGRILAGTAHILTAQAKAAQRSYFAAVGDARKGYRHLEEALARDPNAADAWFALGAYKYFAARLPWVSRVLRFLAFVPGGDVEEGLAGLERVAREGEFFRCEALLLLAYIFDGEHEKDDRRALKYFGEAQSLEPGSPLFALIRSRLHFALGELASAERSSRRAIDLADALPGVAREVVDLARVRFAMTLYYQYRPEEAYAALGPLVGSVAPQLPAGTEKRFWGLLARLRHDLGQEAVPLPAHRKGLPAAAQDEDRIRPVPAAPVPNSESSVTVMQKIRAGKAGEALCSLAGVVEGEPGNVVARYHLARAYQEAGMRKEAAATLEGLLSSGERIPKTLRGWALLRLGDAVASEGRTGEALTYYRRGAALKGFLFRRAATDRIKYPADPLPLEG